MTLTSSSMADVLAGIENSTYEMATESRLARVGLKEDQNIAAILDEYSWLYNLETVRAAGAAWQQATEPEDQERLRRIYYYLLDGYVERQTAGLEDQLVSTEMAATVEVDGETIPYHNVRPLISREPDLERRNRLHEAALGVVEETNPQRSEIIRRRLDTLAADFGYTSYTAYNSEKKRVDYDLLSTRLQQFLDNTEDVYLELMGDWVRRTTGAELGALGSQHFAYISRMGGYDEYFSKEALLDVYRRTLQGMGLDFESQKNIHLDTEDRPSKNPRAVCYAPNPPSEVHLIIKPVGGIEDYAAFFHEAGHAQHYGNERADMDYVNRALGTSYALTEIYSFLLEGLTENHAWLTRMVGIPERVAREIVYYRKLREFFMLRRYVAKLLYELSFYAEPLNDVRNSGLYARTLTASTRLRYDPRNYLNDMDSGYYSADYLRAWITEALLREHLETQYGEDWFSNPGAGELLRGLWATGESRENEDIARMIDREPFDTSALSQRFLALPVQPPS